MSHHIVEVKDLHYKYPDGTNALNGINFFITHGESVGLIGANGAGKSTLLLHLVGCISALSGYVRIGDDILCKENINEIRKRVGLVFQNPQNQLFMPTVNDDVAFGPRNQGLNEDEVKVRVKEALKAVGAEHLINRPPYKLSGGEQRAVSIATVLSMKPDILLLDEPSAGLDPKSRREVIKLLLQFEHTKIITSHDLDLIYEVCNRVILVNEGKVIADDKTENILTNKDLLEQCSLELPRSINIDNK